MALFRSAIAVRLYRRLVLSPHRCERSIGLAILALAYLLRTARQFGSSRRLRAGALLALAACQAAALAWPPRVAAAALGATLLAAATGLVLLTSTQPDDGVGHRSGAKGFTGVLCENTVEAVEALLRREEHEGPLPDFPYLEFDVQECADGELVVFHDPLLHAAFPLDGANAAPAARLVEATGIPFQQLTPQDLTLAQLHSLHLGGRPGLRIPTLQHYLEVCESLGLRRTLAVEVKLLRTDTGRQRLLDLVSGYLRRRGDALDCDAAAARRRCRALGWAGVIAFPHLFAASFGEYGTAEWRHWAAEFKRHGIPVRACHALWLTLVGL